MNEYLPDYEERSCDGNDRGSCSFVGISGDTRWSSTAVAKYRGVPLTAGVLRVVCADAHHIRPFRGCPQHSKGRLESRGRKAAAVHLFEIRPLYYQREW